MRSILPIVCATALALAGAAQAHALLEQSDPRVGGEVRPAPRSLHLRFSEPLAAPFCRVTVAGPAGFGGAGPARPAPGDSRSLIVDLRGAAPPGRYAVHWRVVAADTHATQGDFGFTVRP
jgi:methionine-rich copper-binding protein CopC